jgi:hypothetical protein
MYLCQRDAICEYFHGRCLMNVFTSNKLQDTAFFTKTVKMPALDAANSNIRQPESFTALEGRNRLQLGLKRAFDIFGAASALIILFPVFLTIALLIVIDDGGPVFFRQIRWGLKVARSRSTSSAPCGRISAIPPVSNRPSGAIGA